TLAEELRDAGFTVVLHVGSGGFKAQMKKADASGALAAVILGDNEIEAGTVSVKLLRGESRQMEISQEEMVDQVFELLYGEGESS
ncbi:MAG: His/Gly/Thr/Pro-type tRNA ligase C-terminal domain-containing protein, partial [Limnobacter sp.]|nr:His/Gly/Thr/Pro-type tRNA ligase C-terminal domain-containing protein [Limnobacter sp.]